MNIPLPIFQNKLSKISWKKIYAREYGVQYSEMAILCLSPKAKYHIPAPSVTQIVIPEENNTAFYVDTTSWINLVESLNKEFTSQIAKLEEYEKQFTRDGQTYLDNSKKIALLNLGKIANQELISVYLNYQENLFRYSVFAWTSFILNNYISEKAKLILDKYIKANNRDSETQEIYNSLFKPEKLAAAFEMQNQIDKYNGKLTHSSFNKLYENYKWLSCLDIHNKPWTKAEFREHVNTTAKTISSKVIPFHTVAKELRISGRDLEYLLIAKRFVYIKDARDDFRRQGVYFARNLFKEIADRMNIQLTDISYLQQSEILDFLREKVTISKKLISQRKKGFVLYLDNHRKLACLTNSGIKKALTLFNLLPKEEFVKAINGTVASKGTVKGNVVIVKGVKDLEKVKNGNILVSVSTHPDYVPAMRRAAAIITDEGGITSHAAIVSREFGIPCIVGTKNATSILKNGDRIEVDAIAGKITFSK